MTAETLLLVAILAPSSALAAAGDVEAKFVEDHCLRCHGPEVKKGRLDLSTPPGDLADPSEFARWVKVHDRVKAGTMPPRGEPRPPAGEVAAALKALSSRLVSAEKAREGAEGRSSLRRLTRTEYEATMQDLFGLPGLPLRDGLPADGVASGFDKVGEALDVSTVQMAKYLDAARLVLERATATWPRPPAPYRERFYLCGQYPYYLGVMNGDCVALKDMKYDVAVPMFGPESTFQETDRCRKEILATTHDSVGVFRTTDESFRTGVGPFSPILPGRYKVRVSTWSFWWDKGRVLPAKKTEVLGVRTPKGLVGHCDAPSLKPRVHEFELWMEADEELLLNPDSLEGVNVWAEPGRSKQFQGPGLAIDWVEVEGPIYDSWPPRGHKALFGSLPIAQLPPRTSADGAGDLPRRVDLTPARRRGADHPKTAQVHALAPGDWSVRSSNPKVDSRKLLKAALPRIFRRPATAAEVERFGAIVDSRLKAGDTFEGAMRQAYTAALCSPEFLFHLEAPGKLDDWAVAARLSYFLWDSIGDDDLYFAASRGELKDGGEALRQQVRRMLKDPRSDRFVHDFLGQWLGLTEIAATSPDAILYPEFRPYIQDCMIAESRAFFRRMLDEDLGVRCLVASDFAMLNAQLAQLYGIPGVPEGHALAPVKLPPGSHRGGVITQASVLKITANGTTTSPVKRGAWVLDRLLGTPPEPPPPTISAIDPDVRGATTIRKQLDLHRDQASCASCHRAIDPPGFAPENFDVIGRWRDRYRSRQVGDPAPDRLGAGHYPVRYRLALPVDGSGVAADGSKFAGIDDFRAVLLKEERQLARNYLRRLLTFATGRDAGFSDREALEAILDRCQTPNLPGRPPSAGAYPARALIEELVVSDLFLRR